MIRRPMPEAPGDFDEHNRIEKNQQVLTVEQDTQAQIAAVNSDITNINIKTNQYKQLSDNLKNIMKLHLRRLSASPVPANRR